MDTGTQTACTASKREEMASADLARRLNEAREQLNDAIESADLERMTALRAELKSLPERITLATLRELKERLNAIEIELQKNDEKKKLIRSVIAKRKLELQEKLKELEPHYENLNKAALEQSFADNDYQLLLIERREKKARLFNLADGLKEEAI